eukprot:jgi/Mesvir1/19298/Mv25205-RA.1
MGNRPGDGQWGMVECSTMSVVVQTCVTHDDGLIVVTHSSEAGAAPSLHVDDK